MPVNNSASEWQRLPKPGEKCSYSGLSRSKLYELITPSKENGFRPPVESIVLKSNGKERGVRLYSKSSYERHLKRMQEAQASNRTPGPRMTISSDPSSSSCGDADIKVDV